MYTESRAFFFLFPFDLKTLVHVAYDTYTMYSFFVQISLKGKKKRKEKKQNKMMRE